MSAAGRPLKGTPLQRALLRSAWVAAALAWGACMTAAAPARESESSAASAAPLKVGIIGAGHIGGTLASLWVKAGHELLVSSRHPEQLQGLVRSLGPRARAGTPREAALFGDVVLISVPYAALPQVGRDLKTELRGKIVLETGNPYPQRDGDMALEARRKGTGVGPGGAGWGGGPGRPRRGGRLSAGLGC